jgi:hypothetical protein
LWEELRAGIPPVYDIRDHSGVVTDIYRRLLAGGIGGGSSRPSQKEELNA